LWTARKSGEMYIRATTTLAQAVSENEAHGSGQAIHARLVGVCGIISIEHNPAPADFHVSEPTAVHGHGDARRGISVVPEVAFAKLEAPSALRRCGRCPEIANHPFPAQTGKHQSPTTRPSSRLIKIRDCELVIVQAVSGEYAGSGMTFLIPIVHEVPSVDVSIPLRERIGGRRIIGVAKEKPAGRIRVVAITQGHKGEPYAPIGSDLKSGFVLGNILVFSKAEIVVEIQLSAGSANGVSSPFYCRGVQFCMPQLGAEIELAETDPWQYRPLVRGAEGDAPCGKQTRWRRRDWSGLICRDSAPVRAAQ